MRRRLTRLGGTLYAAARAYNGSNSSNRLSRIRHACDMAGAVDIWAGTDATLVSHLNVFAGARGARRHVERQHTIAC